jgi:hypothetical protein
MRRRAAGAGRGALPRIFASFCVPIENSEEPQKETHLIHKIIKYMNRPRFTAELSLRRVTAAYYHARRSMLPSTTVQPALIKQGVGACDAFCSTGPDASYADCMANCIGSGPGSPGSPNGGGLGDPGISYLCDDDYCYCTWGPDCDRCVTNQQCSPRCECDADNKCVCARIG